MEKDRDETARLLRQAQENAKRSSFLKAELEVRLEKADEKSRREAERIISEAREAAEEVFAQLDEMKKRVNDEENAQAVNEARTALRRRLNEKEDALRPKLEVPEEAKSARPVKVGDSVKIKSMGMMAEVVAVSPDRVLTLKAGIMNVTAREDDILLVEGAEKKQKKAPVTSTGANIARSVSISPVIDLRGMESLEAVLMAERYIDNAVMARLKTVTIIHGKGTGALRAAIQQMLKKNKAVKSFRLGHFGEGESGVTVVELK